MKIKTARKFFIPLGVLAALVVNILADVIPLNGHTTVELFHQFKIFFSPADYVYSLKILVYILLIGFAVFQFVPKSRGDEEKLDKIFPHFMIICVSKILWLFLWHYEQFVFTLIIMFVILRSTLQINYILYLKKQSSNKIARMLMYAPFSVYLGWITITTIANATGLLWLIGWGGLTVYEGGWTTLMIVVSGVLGVIKILRDRDGFFPAVIIWVVIGIYVKFPEVALIRYAVISSCLAIGAVALYEVLRIIKQKKEIDY